MVRTGRCRTIRNLQVLHASLNLRASEGANRRLGLACSLRATGSSRLGVALIGRADNLLAVQVTLTLDDNVLDLFGEFITVTDVPLSKEVVLDPDDFAKGLDEGDLAVHVETRVGKDSLGQDVLNKGEKRTDVHVFDMQRVLATATDVHHSVYMISDLVRYFGALRTGEAGTRCGCGRSLRVTQGAQYGVRL